MHAESRDRGLVGEFVLFKRFGGYRASHRGISLQPSRLWTKGEPLATRVLVLSGARKRV